MQIKIFSVQLLLSLIFVSSVVAQENHADFLKGVLAFQKELNAEYADKESSPLTKEDLEQFKKLEFYPANEKFNVKARFVRTENEKPFQMKTTTSRRPVYEKYAEVHFEIEGNAYKLNVYQSHDLRKMAAYKKYLFIPFTDLTSGDGSYGGGRYIDLEIPETDEIILDFNHAYNPYCAYNPKYSCPIPPSENFLDITVEAGVKAFKKY